MFPHEERQVIGGVLLCLEELRKQSQAIRDLRRLMELNLRKGEEIMAAIDDLKTAISSVQDGLNAVADDVTRVLGILQNSTSNDPAIVDATAQLTAIADKLKQMDAAIDAVSPDTPPPAPAPTP